jgi:hypothetical protein
MGSPDTSPVTRGAAVLVWPPTEDKWSLPRRVPRSVAHFACYSRGRNHAYYTAPALVWLALQLGNLRSAQTAG